ncbi:hypothetical protein [Sphingopyxis flava]|uniref:Uncharacterized protein n=1 Tax=Sphingopyxis flava TaxID=1507287 RepID=A0A1T5G4Y4_9SPHN|nr:hypothetical protein [Sphingopyxis flava]SKC03387.1 hypothetical protein SAMN06295937_10579 [Sphingopyxis flava]
MLDHLATTPATVQSESNTLFASLELSKSHWLVTVSAPGSPKFSKYSVAGGDAAALLALLERLQMAAAQRLGAPVAITVIAEAGSTASGCTGCLSATAWPVAVSWSMKLTT